MPKIEYYILSKIEQHKYVLREFQYVIKINYVASAFVASNAGNVVDVLTKLSCKEVIKAVINNKR